LTARKEAIEQRNVTIVSESGLHTLQDLNTVKEAGAKAVLIGESLVKQENIEQGVSNLFAV
jgi:indole-3-glycerol phosphate synthase